MRDEACPVCGETDAWDGDECKVCGFVAPPDKFQDPDVDLHKQLDLRNNGDLDGQDVNDLNADINDRDGDGLDDNTGKPIPDENAMGADDMQPMLSCPNCGYEVEGGEPQTVSTEDSTMGDASEVSPGPSAGDLCPNCGQAPLMSPDEMAEAGLGEDPAIDGADPDAEQDPNVDPGDPNAEPGADEDPSFDPNAQGDLNAPDEDEEDPENEDRGSPFPSDQDAPSSDDSDDDSSDNDDDEDEGKPAKKPFPPGKK